MNGTSTETVGNLPAATYCVWPSMSFAVPENAAYPGFLCPVLVKKPLCHVPGLSLIVNHVNISTYGLAAAIFNAIFASRACWAYETPSENCGFVCSPYSVTQIGTRLPYHFCRDWPNCVIRVSVTFGHFTFCAGPRNGSVGYG